MQFFRRCVVAFVDWNRSVAKRLDKIFPRFFGRTRDHNSDLREMIESWIAARDQPRVLEVGGIDRPLLCRSQHFSYDGLDIELRQKCYEVYDNFLVQSVEHRIPGSYDLVISRMLFEHVHDNRSSFSSMFDVLNPGGAIIHHIPSKYHFYSLLTRAVGSRWQKILIKYLRPNAADGRTGYPTYFDQCSPSQMRKLCESVGFGQISVTAYYRATDYFAFFVPAYVFVAIFENLFEWLGASEFACGMTVVAFKD